MARDASSRRKAERQGKRAETLAAWWLRLKGYRILARDFRVPVGEIDLVARRGRLLVFVEVKRREDLSAAAESITVRQQRRIAQAADVFLQHHPNLRDLDIRFDAVLAVPGDLPRHIVDAWRVSR